MHYERVNYLQDTCNYLHIFVKPYTGKSILIFGLDFNNIFFFLYFRSNLSFYFNNGYVILPLLIVELSQ